MKKIRLQAYETWRCLDVDVKYIYMGTTYGEVYIFNLKGDIVYKYALPTPSSIYHIQKIDDFLITAQRNGHIYLLDKDLDIKSLYNHKEEIIGPYHSYNSRFSYLTLEDGLIANSLDIYTNEIDRLLIPNTDINEEYIITSYANGGCTLVNTIPYIFYMIRDGEIEKIIDIREYSRNNFESFVFNNKGYMYISFTNGDFLTIDLKKDKCNISRLNVWFTYMTFIKNLLIGISNKSELYIQSL